MSKESRLGRLGVLAPAALSACIDASVMGAPAAGAIVSTVVKELSKAFLLKRWFHGVMSAKEAEKLLMKKGNQGSYLVRESRGRTGELVLSVRLRHRVCHVRIRKEQNKYNVGRGEFFEDLTALIEYYRDYPFTEALGEVLRLRQPVGGGRAPRKQFDMSKRPTGSRPPRKPMEILKEVPEDDEEAAGSDSEDNTDPDASDTEEYVLAQASLDPFYARYSHINDNVNGFTQHIGNSPANAHKNRYANVLPYDQTRVHLPRHFCEAADNFSDYINASYVRPQWMLDQMLPEPDNLVTWHKSDWQDIRDPDERRNSVRGIQVPYASTAQADRERLTEQELSGNVPQKFFVATQGCLDSTMNAFWEMILDNDIRVIVMLTEIEETGWPKCERYWPLNGTAQSYGKIEVFSRDEQHHIFYIYRQFAVVKDNKYIDVYHFQLLVWPDHGVPSNVSWVLKYIHEVNKTMQSVANDKENAPKHNIVCVHCSAGVGRTGSFIAIDMLMDRIRIVGAENFNLREEMLAVVQTLRGQRPGMVASVLQYAFIRSALEQYCQEYLQPQIPLAPPVSF